MTETSLKDAHNYDFAGTIARVVLYDDFKSAPRISCINPGPTNEYIEQLATMIYEQSKLSGGTIPYSVIREVSENFIHAQFKEVVVSIFDSGNTIRFADQGPGIQEKEQVKEPGFTSAIEPMKKYIRGVGSGLPIVREYLNERHGSIFIEDNLGNGAVVTVSLVLKAPKKQPPVDLIYAQPLPKTLEPLIHCSEREKEYLTLLNERGDLRITDIRNLTKDSNSTIHATLDRMEKSGLVEISFEKRRTLTPLGQQVALSI